MARRLRIVQSDYPTHVCCRTNNRDFRFNRRADALIVALAIVEGARRFGVLVHHVVLMSNHIHLILSTPNGNLPGFMQLVNSLIAIRCNRAHRRSGHLWGDRYRSCIIDTDEYYLKAVRYIYRNPVRAGMVAAAGEFEHSSFRFLAFGREMPFSVVDDHIVLLCGTREGLQRFYRQLLEVPESREELEDVKRGFRYLFYGSAGFIQRMAGRFPIQA
jgi:putative transposase